MEGRRGRGWRVDQAFVFRVPLSDFKTIHKIEKTKKKRYLPLYP